MRQRRRRTRRAENEEADAPGWWRKRHRQTRLGGRGGGGHIRLQMRRRTRPGGGGGGGGGRARKLEEEADTIYIQKLFHKTHSMAHFSHWSDSLLCFSNEIGQNLILSPHSVNTTFRHSPILPSSKTGSPFSIPPLGSSI